VLVLELNDFIYKMIRLNSDQYGEFAQHSLAIFQDYTLACGYLTEDTHQELMNRCEHIGRMLGTMIRDAKKWCVSSKDI